MKIIQSFWTKPLLQQNGVINTQRLNGGWLHRKLNYYSWVMSCLQLTKFYRQVELITDDLGKEILVHKLKLPYTSVSTELNEIPCYDYTPAVLGKVYAYHYQTKPFLHVDNDVFIWKQFEARLSRAGLVAQNFQAKTFDLSGILDAILTTFRHIPDYLQVHGDKDFVPCSNTAIIGGRDIPFFQTYVQEVFLFLERNAGAIGSVADYADGAYMNIILEQVVFQALAEKCGKPLTYLFSGYDDIPRELGLFHAAGPAKYFVHCLRDFKRYSPVYLAVERITKKMYPRYYQRIKDLVATYEL